MSCFVLVLFGIGTGHWSSHCTPVKPLLQAHVGTAPFTAGGTHVPRSEHVTPKQGGGAVLHAVPVHPASQEHSVAVALS